MIWIFVIILFLILIVLTFSEGGPFQKKSRRRYLAHLAKFLSGQLNPSLQYPHSFQINFRFEGFDFVYEDIDDRVLEMITHKGLLKTKIPVDLTLVLIERIRSEIRDNVKSISDVSSFWNRMDDSLPIPEELKEFKVFTNDADKARRVLWDQKVTKVFLKYRMFDSLGKPVMPLDILDGWIILRFHPSREMKPSLVDLQSHVSSIDEHLAQMIILLRKCEEFRKK